MCFTSTHTTRRQSSRSPRQHKNRTWSTSNIVAGLHLRAHGMSHNAAARSSHLIKSTLSRYWKIMPKPLRCGGSECDILNWYQQHESQCIDEHHHTLLTHVEEDMLSQWITLAWEYWEPVGRDQIIEKAREIIKTQRGTEHTGMTLHLIHTAYYHLALS
jgi:hypothetical protein